MKNLRLLYGLLILIGSCANPIPPSGGLKDTEPPKLDPQRSTSNYQLNFQKQPLTFTFDEFIVLDKADLQVLVSPPLQHKPQIKLKDKTVTFEFHKDEVLLPQTTYVINFGASIKDFTEGNIVPDMYYVLSTGETIDSLQFSAKLYNADERKDADKSLLMLYKDLSDSAVYKSPPDYAARTDEHGSATIKYMKAGRYQVVGLKDENFNYTYDLSNEKAGFLSHFVDIPYAGTTPMIQIYAKENPYRITLVDSSSNQRIRVQLEPDVQGVTVVPLKLGVNYPMVYGNNFIDVYYIDTMRNIEIIVNKPYAKTDTIRHTLSKSKSNKPFLIKEEKTSLITPLITPKDPITISTNVVISKIDSQKIQLYTRNGVALKLNSANLDSSSMHQFKIWAPWKDDSTYQIKLLPGAITSSLGAQNDTMILIRKITPTAVLGSVTYTVDSLNQSFHYIITLTKDKDLYAKHHISASTQFTNTVDHLPPGIYEVNIMEDRNKNGRIDKGSFDRRENPELIYTKRLEQLRENWQVEAVILLSEFKQNEQ